MIVALLPGVSVPSAQLKFWPIVFVHVPLDGVGVPRVNPLGHVSFSVTLLASEGPAFETVMVYVRVMPSPATTWVTPSVFDVERSARVWTVFVSEAVLFPPTGSVVLLLTLTAFVCDPAGVDAGTV